MSVPPRRPAAPLGAFRQGDALDSPPKRPPSVDVSARNVRVSRFAKAAGMWLFVMLGLSLFVHAAIGFGAADLRLGFVDADAFDRAPRMVRIKRAQRDTVLLPGETLDLTETLNADTAAQTAAAQAQAVDALLEDLLTAEPPATLSSPTLDLRPIDESRPATTQDTARLNLPAFEIDPALLATLPGAGPAEASIREDTGLVGRGDNNADVDAADQIAAALLADSMGSSSRSGTNPNFGSRGNGTGSDSGSGSGTPGLRPGVAGRLDARPGTPRTPTTSIDDARPALDAAKLTTIDFAALALEATKNLDIPERLDNDFIYQLAVHRDLDRPADPAYFRVDVTPRDTLRKLATLPKDLVFLIDTSSSMPQSWVEQIALGVEQSFASLNPGDRFNIVVFNDTVRIFADRPVEPTPDRLTRAQSFLRDVRSKGYTDVNAALRQLLRRDVEPGRVYTLILISDGRPTVGVVDARQLINLITRENNRVAGIYCVGAAPSRKLDRRLLDFLAYRNNGFAVYQTNRGRVAGTIRDLTSQLRYPLITDVRMRIAGEHTREVHPDRLPTIHQGQRFSLFGRYVESRPFTMQIDGRSEGGQTVAFTFSQDPDRAADGGDTLPPQWAFWKLQDIYSQLLQRGDEPGLVEQVRALQRRYELETLY
ncbi:MAG: VWA domain-containing protein [Planctomycetota bacterium]